MFNTPYRWIPFLSDAYRKARRQVARRWFAGNKVECPVCEHTFSRWVGDPNLGGCPYCGAAARHRMLKLSLERDWDFHPPRADVLHFAPEWGTERGLRKDPHIGRYVTVDRAARGVDVRCDITLLNFPSETFDVVICSHVLEHVPDDRQAIRELHRVLRPGGIAYVQVPYAPGKRTDEDPRVTDPRERANRWGQFDHVRVYGIDLADRLREPGFHVDELHPVRAMAQVDAVRWGLWDENLFRCVRLSESDLGLSRAY